MARTTITQITDDLDGSKNAEEIRFSYADDDYVIDLSKKNKAALEQALKPYLEAARKAPKATRRRRTSAKQPASGRDLNAVRAWAKKQGIAVSERGRIAGSVLEQYDAAH